MIRTYPEIQQVMRRIEAIVHKYVPDAEVKIAPSARPYAVTYTPRLHSNGGKVVMEFSKRLVESGTWEQIENVVAHEIAHVLAADRDDLSGADSGWHTEEWGDIAQALGGSREVDYYLDVLFQPRYKYRCADCGYTITFSEERHGAPETSPIVYRHGRTTGHYKWYVLDELTGKRWTETI
jgi:predicted SprT family Zn-dependent metalloprotease